MGRTSVRGERRTELARAFARVLGAAPGPGRRSATIAEVARAAGVAPGLVHHHFADRRDLVGALLDELRAELARRLDAAPEDDPLEAYVSAALALGERSDVTAARAWVGVLAEALADPSLFEKVRRVLDAETDRVHRRGRGSLDAAGASAVVAFVVGALVFGAFAPRKAAGFAAPSLRRMLPGLRRSGA